MLGQGLRVRPWTGSASTPVLVKPINPEPDLAESMDRTMLRAACRQIRTRVPESKPPQENLKSPQPTKLEYAGKALAWDGWGRGEGGGTRTAGIPPFETKCNRRAGTDGGQLIHRLRTGYVQTSPKL